MRYAEIVVRDCRALEIPTHAYQAIARVFEKLDKPDSREALTHLGGRYGPTREDALRRLLNDVQESDTPDDLREYVAGMIEVMVEP